MENQQGGCKFRRAVKAVFLLQALFWGGASYAKYFGTEMDFWPLFFGGCAITLLVITALYVGYALCSEVVEKLQKKREKESLSRFKAEKGLRVG